MRISLFFHRDNPWYRSLHEQMRRGLAAAGFEVSGGCGLLEGAALRDWCRERRPDVLFEMNRPRRAIPELPRGIVHVCWIVDFNGRPISYFADSDITYLFGPRWLPLFPYRERLFRWFGPGASPDHYRAGADARAAWGALVGHFPNPWSAAELARNLTGGRTEHRFGDLLPALERAIWTERESLVVHEDYHALAERICRELTGAPLVADAALEYDFSGRLIRLLNRREVVDMVLAETDLLRLYGPDNWTRWPAYARHYHGLLQGPEEMAPVYRDARFNLHEGNGIHFRALDCLCAGGCLFYRERPWDRDEGGIATLFEPGVHYVPFNPDTLGERLERHLADPRESQRIGENAAREVRRAHTWRHRAETLLADLEALHGH